MKRAILVLVILVAIGAGAGAWYYKRGGVEVQFTTTPVTRGDIVDTVGATGTLQAVTTVQVGSQVSGNIQWLGADFNSIVTKGQVIARLDPSLIDAQLQQSQANLNQSKANLTKAQSDLDRSRIQVVDAQQKYTRAKELADRKLLAPSELDSAKVVLDSAQASLASQRATVTQVQAAVTQSEAGLNQAQVNRDHTVIVAPIDGIVTQRSVDVGQTVAASMQAPTLFVIAADLREMQVNANIDEADVGRIRPGQHVTFRVDAYPTDSFTGTVTQIRLQPVVVQNVTTYGTVITVPNAQLKLKPGMTANVRIEIAKRQNAMRVPNTALRFRATTEMFEAINQAVPPDLNQGAGGRGRNQGAMGARGPSGASDAPSAPVAAAPAATGGRAAASAPAMQNAPRPGGNETPGVTASGRGGFGGGQGGGGRGGGRGGFDPARMMDRFKSMTPDEQTAFIARLKERGTDTSAFEAAMPAPKTAAKRPASAGATQQAQTIDALFAPLPVVESRGRAWLFMDHQLKAVNLRLGISDGTYTELVSGELQENMEVVTAVTGLGTTRGGTTPGANGNPLMPGGGRGGPGGFGAPGGRGR